MIDTELENSDRSVILKRQTFNAQPAFGKPAVRWALSVQSSKSAMENCQAVARSKNCLGSNGPSPSRLRSDGFALHVGASAGWSRRRDSNPRPAVDETA